MLFGTVRQPASMMAREVEKVFANSSFSRVFLAGGLHSADRLRFEASVRSIIGHLAGDTFLSDVTRMFAAEH